MIDIPKAALANLCCRSVVTKPRSTGWIDSLGASAAEETDAVLFDPGADAGRPGCIVCSNPEEWHASDHGADGFLVRPFSTTNRSRSTATDTPGRQERKPARSDECHADVTAEHRAPMISRSQRTDAAI